MKKKIASILFSIIPLIILLYKWDTLPEKTDIQEMFVFFSIAINAPKKVLLILSIVSLLLQFLPYVLYHLDPRRENHHYFQKSMLSIFLALSIFVSSYICLLIFCFDGLSLSYSTIVPILGLIFIIWFGNYLGKIKVNNTIGFTLPWIIKDEILWKRVHRFTSFFWVAMGVLGIFFHAIFANKFLFGVILFLILTVPLVYSLVEYKKK